jgi:hypothetical protein
MAQNARQCWGFIQESRLASYDSTSLKTHAAGSRLSRLTAARRGKQTGPRSSHVKSSRQLQLHLQSESKTGRL